MSLIQVKGLNFSYGNRTVFKDVNLSLGKGQILCLLGPNGCGKTTLLDCILGLLKPNHGAITINNRNISSMEPHEIAQKIAYVPQAHNKTFPYRVIDIVLMGRAAYTSAFSSPNDEDMKIAEEALRVAGIHEYKERIYTELSGGEGQLVMMARALAQQATIMILDEPTAHLDFKHELMILETIVQLVKERGLSLIMATHFPNHAFYFENNDINTSIVMMSNNRITLAGPPSEVLSENNMRDIFNVQSKVLSYLTGTKGRSNYIIPLNTCEKVERMI
ncbi:ABC transporter ATP-binding protein [Natronincola ferrireducens]|uniref:Iron complex transport system ATP-binding protein n=1 Tax=Natronincola ferrireducens TaxID=393762 RepID=A0A1G8ZPB3_9FIRM|nr:ABC transporter ATP-binding protein [Natronincola ferrireducens]SDK16843.1 iron complex transport system ATP-binding protein [Natronincola ferrireducens]